MEGGGAAAQQGWNVGRTLAIPAQTSQVLVSIFRASTYVSEKRTTSMYEAGEDKAGSRTRIGRWQESPAWRSPMHTS